ncbi:MAG: alpha-ketoglutarate-dependent dioxygenase AlkB [Pseudomonadota bacterium]
MSRTDPHLTPLEDAEHTSLPPGGTLDHVRGWLTAVESESILCQLTRELDWQQPDIVLFGRSIPIPRLQAWIGEPEANYRYSGRTFSPAPWHRALAQIRERLTHTIGTQFNSVLANLYRDGNDCMHWHADDEPELGPEPCIASVSLGASRDFLLQPRDRHRGTLKVTLSSGDLLVMRGTVQRHWRHSLPRRRRGAGHRINLTFRQVASPSAGHAHR